jgi:hypothetical protein
VSKTSRSASERQAVLNHSNGLCDEKLLRLAFQAQSRAGAEKELPGLHFSRQNGRQNENNTFRMVGSFTGKRRDLDDFGGGAG